MRKVYMFNAEIAIAFVTQFSEVLVGIIKDVQDKHLAIMGGNAMLSLLLNRED